MLVNKAERTFQGSGLYQYHLLTNEKEGYTLFSLHEPSELRV